MKKSIQMMRPIKTLKLSLGPLVVTKVADSRYQYDADLADYET
jgi:hypothetical protein